MKLFNRIPTTMKQPFNHAPSLARRVLLALGCGLLLGTTLPRVQAAPTEAMTFQGFLVDANGNPLATNNPANYPVIFRIFAAASGGASLWSEQQIVTVDKGNFSVILSEGTAVGGEPRPLLSAVMGTNGADRYIQISVTIGASTLDMLPRMRLLPAPFAFLSTSANQLVNPTGAVVVNYANSRVEVAGNFFTSGTISGNGSGLTSLTAAQIPNVDASKITSGTLADLRLSPNVPLLANNNAFSGNIGIGTPNTTFPLTIGNQTLGDKISLWGQSGNSFGFGIQSTLLQIHTSDPAGDIVFGYGSSAAMTETMRIEGTGNVGIGTNAPPSKLTVVGGVRARGGAPGASGANNNGYAFIGPGDSDSGLFSSADGQVELHTQNAERMRINSAGNVGIGVTNPVNRLDVNGTISASGEVRMGTSPQYSAIGALGAVKIISGVLPGNPANGATANGAGWSATGGLSGAGAAGHWRVTFSNAFTTLPAVSANWVMPSPVTWNGANAPTAPIIAMSSGGYFIVPANTQASDINGTNYICNVSFIAIGTR